MLPLFVMTKRYLRRSPFLESQLDSAMYPHRGRIDWKTRLPLHVIIVVLTAAAVPVAERLLL